MCTYEIDCSNFLVLIDFFFSFMCTKTCLIWWMDFLCDMKHESILISPPSIKIEGERELKKKKVSFNGGNHKTGGGKMQNFIPCAT